MSVGRCAARPPCSEHPSRGLGARHLERRSPAYATLATSAARAALSACAWRTLADGHEFVVGVGGQSRSRDRSRPPRCRSARRTSTSPCPSVRRARRLLADDLGDGRLRRSDPLETDPRKEPRAHRPAPVADSRTGAALWRRSSRDGVAVYDAIHARCWSDPRFTATVAEILEHGARHYELLLGGENRSGRPLSFPTGGVSASPGGRRCPPLLYCAASVTAPPPETVALFDLASNGRTRARQKTRATCLRYTSASSASARERRVALRNAPRPHNHHSARRHRLPPPGGDLGRRGDQRLGFARAARRAARQGERPLDEASGTP